MAKIKFPSRTGLKREIFHNTGDLFALDRDEIREKRGSLRPTANRTPASSPASFADNLEVHPSITDFVINARRKEIETAADSDSSLSLDRSELRDTEKLTFISFGSGSSGNCSYLGTRSEGILIDAGVDAENVREQLRSHGISPRCVKAIIITHDHTDHVKYVYPLVKKRPDLGIYCTPKTLTGLLRRHSISRRVKDFHRPIYKEFAFNAGPFEIIPFEVSHDGTDNVGYFIRHGQTAIAIATDLGCITPRVDFYMRQANHIVIESNYDAEMLMRGPYPMHLKARIAARNGHLDNAVTGEFLASIMSERLHNIFLCHLSQDNNRPEIAVETVRKSLANAGIDSIGDGSGSVADREKQLQLVALPRTTASALFTLR
ncbi:MAG: MBL fold metallo-hydrolase [Paramuribaculum sp.]|nr:MBL fold metallo-hydrolase [Paramuribaculum sp.]MDE6323731.1 MBL fold metallo-hydrolase [Paramuribaculum sp.]MDE6488707.1 MBL fold metallo-hydrolase [Paramuribaculum sp.]